MQATAECRIEVIVEGDPLEMGVQQGSSLSEKIRSSAGILRNLEAFRLMQPAWMPYGLYRRASELRAMRFLQEPFEQTFPDAFLRMKGISTGSQTSLGFLHLLHALEPMLSDVSRCAAVPALGGCSAVAVRGSRSASGEPIIARNFDYLPLVQPLYTVRESRPRSGFRSLDFTMAPFAGAVDGVNENGLCITYDYAYVTDFRGIATAPISISIAEALERCSTVSEAAKWIMSRPRWGGGILMLADAAGDIASLELSNTQSRLRRPSNGADVIFHTNTFATDDMRRLEMDADARFTNLAPSPIRGRSVHESSHLRNRRFEELLRGSEPLDGNILATIMSDHETGGRPPDTAICRHGDYWNTTATLQFFPASRRMRVAFDSPCRAVYEEFAL